MSHIEIKICGLSTRPTLDAALSENVDFVGFVHFPMSPRHVDLETARRLSLHAKGKAKRVLLLVDPGDDLIDAAVATIEPDLIQLHGPETPDRLVAIRQRTGKPVMKALGIATRADLVSLAAFEGIADRILLDAKPPPGAALPGGNGRSFDWTLLEGMGLPASTMLSGGLTPENVAEAIERSGLRAVDVSSGVETRPGEKDPGRIAAFVAAVRRG